MTLRNRGWSYGDIDVLCREVALNDHVVCVSCPACINKDRKAGCSHDVDDEQARTALFLLPPNKR